MVYLCPFRSRSTSPKKPAPFFHSRIHSCPNQNLFRLVSKFSFFNKCETSSLNILLVSCHSTRTLSRSPLLTRALNNLGSSFPLTHLETFLPLLDFCPFTWKLCAFRVLGSSSRWPHMRSPQKSTFVSKLFAFKWPYSRRFAVCMKNFLIFNSI